MYQTLRNLFSWLKSNKIFFNLLFMNFLNFYSCIKSEMLHELKAVPFSGTSGGRIQERWKSPIQNLRDVHSQATWLKREGWKKNEHYVPLKSKIDVFEPFSLVCLFLILTIGVASFHWLIFYKPVAIIIINHLILPPSLFLNFALSISCFIIISFVR